MPSTSDHVKIWTSELKVNIFHAAAILRCTTRSTYWTNSEWVLEYNYRLGTQQSWLWPVNSRNTNCNTLNRAGGVEFTQVFFSFHSKLKDQCLLLSPEKVAVVVAVVVREGGEGRWLVWAPLLSDIWSWSCLPGVEEWPAIMPSPARHLGSSGETDTTWWVALALLLLFPPGLRPPQPQSASFREAYIMISTLSEIFPEQRMIC